MLHVRLRVEIPQTGERSGLSWLGEVNEKLDDVRTQTNGNLSRRNDKLSEQESELIELHAPVARKQGAHAATDGLPTA